MEEQAQIQKAIQKASPDPEGGALEAQMAFQQMEQHLSLAKGHLSPGEFEDYSLLIKENMEINVKSMNPKADQDKLEKKGLNWKRIYRSMG